MLAVDGIPGPGHLAGELGQSEVQRLLDHDGGGLGLGGGQRLEELGAVVHEQAVAVLQPRLRGVFNTIANRNPKYFAMKDSSNRVALNFSLKAENKPFMYPPV